jgi:hypothetical protein
MYKEIDEDIPIDDEVYVYGTIVKDFHTVDKNYTYTLNVCVTQELHRKITLQDEHIKELEAKMANILKYLSL